MATNNADIGFEKQIRDAACVLRGNMDASEYKNVVPGLIFLNYISDRFEEKHREPIEEGDGFEEDIDEYTSEGMFSFRRAPIFCRRRLFKYPEESNDRKDTYSRSEGTQPQKY